MSKTRRFWCALLAACLLVAGLGASAADGDGKAPATLSYLKDTFLPALEKGIAGRVKEDTKAVSDAALAQAEQVGKKHTGAAQSGWTISETPQPTVFNGGDTLNLDEGGSFLWLAGAGAAGAGLVDATAGAEVPEGAALAVGHRYLNGQEGASARAVIRSDKAQAAPAGRWSLTSGGQDVTGFYDLCRGDWFYDGVRWVLDKKIFVGVSATSFDPDGAVTRAMLAAVLHRLDGGAPAEYAGTFSDVPAGQWYTQGVAWAAAKGVIGGKGDGTFSPEESTTREQIAVILFQYAKYLGLDVSAAGSLETFGDCASVSPWARDAMAWAVGEKIINGSGGFLLPQGGATRAQLALLLQHFQVWRGADG